MRFSLAALLTARNIASATIRANSQLRYALKENNRDVNVSAERIIRHIIARGRVQGVGFRAFVEHQALRHGIEGWVRNRRDGSVEAVFAGSQNSVDDMIAACKAGPPSARVDALDQRDGTEAELAERRPGEVFSCLATA
jgi:acylphosphatase